MTDQGTAMLRKLLGEERAAEVRAAWSRLSPDFAHLVTNFLAGELCSPFSYARSAVPSGAGFDRRYRAAAFLRRRSSRWVKLLRRESEPELALTFSRAAFTNLRAVFVSRRRRS